VLIADDHSVVRWALRSLLQEHGIATVAEAASLSRALDLARESRPDVVLLGIPVGTPAVVDLVRAITTHGSRVLAYGDSEPDPMRQFLSAGGMGCLSRSAPVREFVTAVRAVAEGKQWLSSSTNGRHQTGTDKDAGRPALSDRERQVCCLIARGLSSSQIAERLFVSLNTVETHRYRIFRKLGVHNRADLVDYVLRTGLVSL